MHHAMEGRARFTIVQQGGGRRAAGVDEPHAFLGGGTKAIIAPWPSTAMRPVRRAGGDSESRLCSRGGANGKLNLDLSVTHRQAVGSIGNWNSDCSKSA